MNTQSRNKQNTVRNVVFSAMSFIIVLVLISPALAQSSAQAAKELSTAFSAAAKMAMPAVVSIKVEKSVEVGPVRVKPFQLIKR